MSAQKHINIFMEAVKNSIWRPDQLHRDTGAKKMNAYLNAGAYDTETHEMVRITDPAEAARLAQEGYLVVASMLGYQKRNQATGALEFNSEGRPHRGDGHIAVVTGLTPGTEPTVANLRVYQAGSKIGDWSLEDGFYQSNVNRVELYVWKERE